MKDMYLCEGIKIPILPKFRSLRKLSFNIRNLERLGILVVVPKIP